ncbi:N-acetyltransferase [Pseudomonadota bacterium]
MESARIEIREVSGSKDLKTFISVPWSLYQDDPNWVPPLKFERKEAFAQKNPFFLHARWKAWIAYQGGNPIGRISAQIDDLYLQRHDAHTGFFGLVEAPEDPAVFAALFSTAESWLKEQGMRSILGPFNLNINQEIGCLVEGFDSPPYVMMGHAKSYYDNCIKACGFESAQDTLAYEIEAEKFAMPETIQRLLQRLEGKITVRQVDRKNTPAELEVLRSIFNDAWSENWGFVPFTKEEFQAVGKELFMIVPPDFSWIAEADGEPAAFVVLLPNLNEAIADLNGRLFPFGWARLLWRLKVRSPKTGRIPLMGVRKKYQQTRLGPALAFASFQSLHEPAMGRGMKKVEMSWILEQNKAMRNIIEKVGGVTSKKYRMYRKPLVS